MKKASSQKIAANLFSGVVSPGNWRSLHYSILNFYKAKMLFHQEENQCNIVYSRLRRASFERVGDANRTKTYKILPASSGIFCKS
ncbi:hypothetical protein FYJ74_11225 [Pyramidobacter sp. SM-530-WT-4B]|uniref:Uncharacterized protein n=1 Tax=Pyramidobacter porci TaxID=2605789 RepID=A0A6L5YE92_9BACT|nr:hypothetical protein [Pyramidobacter porci]MCI6259862.1 hypothetical protein [Pyramidobacter sp.]MDY2648080.1 hypothetical protein [Pyramidobacter porci]MST56591.1 hypothetical protein [Pyramidobacter porci]